MTSFFEDFPIIFYIHSQQNYTKKNKNYHAESGEIGDREKIADNGGLGVGHREIRQWGKDMERCPMKVNGWGPVGRVDEFI